MFYATNKLRHSTYFCTPSGKHNKAEALLLLSLSVLHLFFLSPQKGCKKLAFFTAPFFYLFIIFLSRITPRRVLKNLLIFLGGGRVFLNLSRLPSSQVKGWVRQIPPSPLSWALT